MQEDLPLLLIDALLGTDIKGEIREPMGMAVDLFNRLEWIKVSVEVPSDINADTGERAEKVCEADLIVTFHDIKMGLMNLKKKTIIRVKKKIYFFIILSSHSLKVVAFFTCGSSATT